MAWTKPAATLAAFHAALCDTTPADTVAANELAQVDLQTRGWLYDYLATIFESSANTIKPAAINAATLAGKVSGTADNSLTATANSVIQGTIATLDLKDLAVTAGKIAANTITASQIAAGTLTATELAANAVTTAKILNDAVDGDKIKDGDVDYIHMKADSVRTAAIKDENVTTGKLAANAVTGAKLVAGTAEGQLLVAGASPYTFAVKAMSGAGTLDKDGVLTLATSGISVIEEQGSAGTSAGESAACASGVYTNVRGAAVAWVEKFRTTTAAIVTIEGGSTGHFSLVAGTYLIEATVPAYKAGKHVARLVHYNSSDVVQARFYGSAANAAAADACQTTSQVRALVTCAATDYFVLDHWTEVNQLVNGLGLATNAGGTSMAEVFSQVRIQRLA